MGPVYEANAAPRRRQRVIGSVAVVALAAFVLWSSGIFPKETDDYTGQWVDGEGSPASRGESRDFTYEVRASVGPEHCDWDSVVFLRVGWPLGTTQGIGLPDSARKYIRDPDNVVRFRDGLQLDAALPEGSTSTGYSTGDVELWLGPEGGDEYVYLVEDPDDVERWPRALEPPACA